MSSPYQDNFYKIAAVGELHAGKPRLFHAAGVAIVVRLDESGVSAIDGSSLKGGAGAATGSAEWDALHEKAGLAVRIEKGEVWVCLEGCRPD